ncbi:MAG: DNA primase [Firmicutes bacterium]|nr:DNA primase [Bacillota bacterium]
MSDIVEQIKNSIDIVDVISSYVPLKKAGSNYKGLCPFHGEKTPSFNVSQEKQFYHCFGCGAHGDVISFVQQMENLDFLDAVEKLAERAGLEYKRGTGSKAQEEKRDRLYELSRQAARHFYNNLRDGDNPGIRYVMKRGISPETAKKFGIGYAKDAWQDMADHLAQLKLPEAEGIEIGLLSAGKKNRAYDKFRNRVIFPIFNARGKVIGFGGRAIDDSMPKYLNSPESEIFKKKDNLYGLNLAKSAIRKQNTALVVEGYMDVVSLVEAGIEIAVASLGTALTPEQAKLLKRYADTVVLSYDSDAAGQAATLRGIDILRDAGLKVKVLRVEGGKDPDEYIRKYGKKAFEELIEKAVSFMEYKVETIGARYDLSTTEGSIGFLEEISGELRKVRSPVEQDGYIRKVAEMTGFSESAIRREVEQGQTKDPVPAQPVRQEEKQEEPFRIDEKRSPVLRLLVKLMITHPDLITAIAGNDEISEYFYGSGYEHIMEQLVMQSGETPEVDIGAVCDGLKEPEERLLRSIDAAEVLAGDEETIMRECIRKIRIDNLTRRQAEITKVLEILNEEEDAEQIRTLSRDLMEIGKEIKNLNERSSGR